MSASIYREMFDQAAGESNHGLLAASAACIPEHLGSFDIVSVTAETNTLPDPLAPNIWLRLTMKTDGGDRVITATSKINQSANTTITFNDVDDTILLHSVTYAAGATGFRWSVVSNDGCTLG